MVTNWDRCFPFSCLNLPADSSPMCFELQMMLLMLVGIFSDLSPLQTYNNISWTGAKTICMLRQDVLCLKRVDQILTLLCSFGKRATIGSTHLELLSEVLSGQK